MILRRAVIIILFTISAAISAFCGAVVVVMAQAPTAPPTPCQQTLAQYAAMVANQTVALQEAADQARSQQARIAQLEAASKGAAAQPGTQPAAAPK